MRSRAVNNDQSRLDDKELNNDIEEAEIDAPGSSRQNSIIPIVTFLHAYPLELLLPHPVRLSGQNFFEEKISHFLFQELVSTGHIFSTHSATDGSGHFFR